MYSNVQVAGIRQIGAWTASTTVAGALDDLGLNSGNMMFTEALCRLLGRTSPIPFSLPERELEGCDALVLAVANWINEYDDFGWLADRIERSDMAVFLVGVGAQASMDMVYPRIKPGTLRLLKVVAERSVSIAARGEFTCDVLEHFGIKNAVPVGCPSLLLAGSSGIEFTQRASTARTVVHGTRHGYQQAVGLQKFMYQQAFKHDYDLLLQSEHPDIVLALDLVEEHKLAEKAYEAVQGVYGAGSVDATIRFLKAHGLFYFNYESWISAMKARTFCVGTRIHGTIASILAGTHATLIAHDSRTLEMAKAMSIPYVEASSIPTDVDMDVEKLLEISRYSNVAISYDAYRQKYMEYFEANRLATSPIAMI
ncbi:polysaccharide pyruvyl transferase family protein [Aminobacter sp. HY435]|uniref:polysaccharide pyruvyl transferase family protein n=1 Tax=Aminobacter sp. HY435 TaxID=2970917 RepID=UPI0022B9CFF0|nr:polysaccharide pyruvyl transferase family protein [Aminobacter sp. HY435]